MFILTDKSVKAVINPPDKAVLETNWFEDSLKRMETIKRPAVPLCLRLGHGKYVRLQRQRRDGSTCPDGLSQQATVSNSRLLLKLEQQLPGRPLGGDRHSTSVHLENRDP